MILRIHNFYLERLRDYHRDWYSTLVEVFSGTDILPLLRFSQGLIFYTCWGFLKDWYSTLVEVSSGTDILPLLRALWRPLGMWFPRCYLGWNAVSDLWHWPHIFSFFKILSVYWSTYFTFNCLKYDIWKSYFEICETLVIGDQSQQLEIRLQYQLIN